MEAKLIRPSEAAKLKGVSRTAIYAAIKDGRLSAQMVLGSPALNEAEVLAWTPAPRSGRPKGIPMNDEAKERISSAQKKRWDSKRQNK